MLKICLALVATLIALPACAAPHGKALTVAVCNLITGIASAAAAGTCIASPATCNAQTSTPTLSINSGSAALSATTNTWAAGDVGQTISIAGAGSSSGVLTTTISAFTDAQHITLGANAGTTLSSSVQEIAWGHDDSAAFTTFNSWAQSQTAGQVELFIPSGYGCYIASTTVACGTLHPSQVTCPFAGLANVVVSGYGSSLYMDRVVSVAGFGLVQDSLHSARTSTINKGDSCASVTLQPQATVSGAANNGSGKVRLSVNSTSGFTTGTFAYIAGIVGTTEANGGFQQVTVVDNTHLDLAQVTFSNAYVSGGAIGSVMSLFSVGQYVMVSGFDLQGLWQSPFGFPPNHHWFEHKKITSANAGTGQLCFDSAFNNKYESTWPNYNTGDATEIDQGGPATVYVLDNTFATTVTIQGLTLLRVGNQFDSQGLSTTYRDVTFLGKNCGIPSQNLSITYINATMAGCILEVDKLVGTITFNNVTIYEVDFQSSSIDLFQVTNSNITHVLSGHPKKAVISNSTIADPRPGAYAYGRSDEFDCTSCTFGTTISPKGVVDSGVNSAYTMSGGIITVPNTHGAVPWAVPGTNLFWNGQRQSETAFRVVDVTQDATNTYVHTSLTGGFPSVPLSSGSLAIQAHPAPKFTCVSCTGTAEAVSLSQAGAGIPLYAYQTYTYTGAVGAAAQPTFAVWGNLTSLSINVTNAYTGAGALSFHLSQFDNWPVLDSTGSCTGTPGTACNYGPVVNAKIAGQRTITLSGVTGTQSGDTGLATGDATQWWFTGTSSSGPLFSADVSGSCPGAGCPSVTVTIQTNQGVQHHADAPWLGVVSDNDNAELARAAGW